MWRDKWEENPVNVQFDEMEEKRKYYCLDSFHILQVTDFM